jgi:acyl-CoA thioester hydrolase
MPATHIEAYKVRYYECDAFGFLKGINYLRWMQEAAFAASGAVGYDFAEYDRIGHLWLVRDTEVEFLNPLKYEDEVEIRTWVEDFRRFRSLRAYEVRNTRTGVIAARASTDWVYVKSETLRPARIPPEMQIAFYPEGAPEEGVHRVRFPKSVPPPDPPFSTRKTVSWSDIDMMWHMNNAAYFRYIEFVEQGVSDAFGWPIKRMVDSGFRIQNHRLRIDYRQPAALGEEIEISTWCSDVRGESTLRHYEIHRVSDGELLLQARARWGCVDLNTEGPIRIPQVYLRSLADNIDIG